MTTDYPYKPIPFTDVTISDNFWSPRIETNRRVTIPYDFEKCEETGRIDNFDKAAKQMPGAHEGLHFNDSDVFKVIEGAAFSLQVHPDAELESYVDGIIDKIAAAQEDDGYIYTARTIDPSHPHEFSGPERWSNLPMSHELYNVGHMYEAAVAYYQATGKRTFLDVAIKSADHINDVFNVNGLRDVPGHQEIEMGLVKLYRVTGNQKYLDLAKFFLDERGHANGRALQKAFGSTGYMQDHLPVTEQREAVGHAVRAVYMYSGMADVAALTGDDDYVHAIQKIWENVVYKKLALTGGIGARHEGEAFGEDYELPNLTSYNETCAAIGSIYWNHRLFLLNGQSKYYDIIERTLYNGFLSGISLEGNTFFYVNPLMFDGDFHFNREDSITRQPWFTCSCCPTNVVRLLPSLSGYIYAVREDRLYVNLYIGNETTIRIADADVKLTQETDYPWDETIQLTIGINHPAQFTLSLRVPGWVKGDPVPGDLYRYLNDDAEDVTVRLNGEILAVDISDDGYISIERRWQPDDKIELVLPMTIRRVVANDHVTMLVGQVALERGPIVYAAEAVDNGGHVRDLVLADEAPLHTESLPDLLGGLTVIKGQARGQDADRHDLIAIPYYAWSHRGIGEMTVWFARE